MGEPVLTLQGKTESAVIIRRLRVIDVERRTPPSDAVVIFPDGGGGGVLAVRYFELNMSDPPQVISRRGIEDPDGHRDPAVKLPVKVSSSDPEQFVFHITGPPCFCDWKLAIDWKSGKQSGTMIVDRGFGKIRSDTARAEKIPSFLRAFRRQMGRQKLSKRKSSIRLIISHQAAP